MANEPQQDTLRVLLVEDNDDDAAIARRVFAQCGLGVQAEIARDGPHALDLLIRAHGEGRALPDLVLLDLNLPRLSGLEVLRSIKALPELHDIPVILLTGSDDDDSVRQGEDLGAHSHITKPMKLDSFVWIAKSVRHYWQRLDALARLDDQAS